MRTLINLRTLPLLFFILILFLHNSKGVHKKKAYIINYNRSSNGKIKTIAKNNKKGRVKSRRKCKVKYAIENDLTSVISQNKPINVGIFGSTGSIGTNTLSIIRECNKIEKKFNVEALYVNKNVEGIYEQAKEFLPKYVCIHDPSKYEELKKLLENIKNYNPIILIGNEGMKQICSSNEIDKIVIGIDSFQGLYSTIYAIKNNKTIALANKESIVSAGFFLKKLLTVHKNSTIIPVDSEHNAIFQCLNNNILLKSKCLQENYSKINQINKIFLCSSGGPFQNLSIDELKNVSSEKALKHPKWNMGKKISIDSATMMNKGLEVIEAHFLFDIDYNDIEIIVHKECIMHSCVEFLDKSVISQMYYPDMRVQIIYALTWPNRINTNLKSLNFEEISPLTFYKPSLKHFPCINLAYHAGRKSNFFPTVLNASNEVVNNLFLNNKIKYFDIPAIISQVLESFNPQQISENPEDLMKQILNIHNWSKQKAMDIYNTKITS
ncbi:1-deoxy-D-xylulose 5-phosphate reductoisomerase [Plasmodium yoelii 17X]|uniref:1-deoxy-D-xylulose 5-phosphate reductoisomerase, apicoplastic n=1 Tax=Plasmodium yoelii 17X TaxID=1323249 RepID=V7PWN7_PLAYE|nr:1-deoxy-D-xylulose 5-phosphate reductoisomerase [Plasmodium yoelii 17X]